MSSTRLLKARLKRFRKTRGVLLFEPTPLDDIERLHEEGLSFYEPALYIPGQMLVQKAARRDAESVLRSLDVDFDTRDVTPEGLARLHVASTNIPDLALEVEDSIRGTRRTKSAGAMASDGEKPYGNRADSDIRSRLDNMGRRLNEPTLASPNHCFTPTPVCGVGPADEPIPADPIPPPQGTAGKGVRIAVIDTGIFTDISEHPWLAKDVHYTCSDVERPDRNRDGIIDYVAGHGHFVAGIIRTAAPGSTIFVERLFHNGTFIHEWQLRQKLEQVLDADPHIINLSLTGQTFHGGPPVGLRDVWRRLKSQRPRIVVVASAGNAGVNHPFWPAAQPEVLSVGAVDRSSLLPAHPRDFSNYGPWVDVYALGVDVVNAYTTGKLKYEDPAKPASARTATFTHPFCSWSGTSFSAPLVTGRIAARMTSTTSHLSAKKASELVVADAHAATLAAGIGPNGTTIPVPTAPDGSPIHVVR